MIVDQLGAPVTAMALLHDVCVLSDVRTRVIHLKALCHRAEMVASSVDGTVRHFDVRTGCMDVDQLGALSYFITSDSSICSSPEMYLSIRCKVTVLQG